MTEEGEPAPAAGAARAAAEEEPDARRLRHPCGCLPECTVNSYRVQRSSIPLQGGLVDAPRFYAGLDPVNHTVVHVFFEDMIGTRYRLSTYTGWIELLASIGGIMSLFLGLSIVCLFELIYFFTLRVLGEMLAKGKGKGRVEDEPAARKKTSRWAEVAPPLAPMADAAVAPVHHWSTAAVAFNGIQTGVARDFLRPPAGHSVMFRPEVRTPPPPMRRRRRY